MMCGSTRNSYPTTAGKASFGHAFRSLIFARMFATLDMARQMDLVPPDAMPA